MSCIFCSCSNNVNLLPCGCYVHVNCFRDYCSKKSRFECPRCHVSVTKAHFDKYSSEWIIGIADSECLHGCFKVTQESKIIPFDGGITKWRRRNGRLTSHEWLDLSTDIIVG
jgi:hypothetical protein